MRLHIRLRIRRDSEEPLKGKDVEPFFWLEGVMLIALISHPCIIELESRYRYILTGGTAYDVRLSNCIKRHVC